MEWWSHSYCHDCKVPSLLKTTGLILILWPRSAATVLAGLWCPCSPTGNCVGGAPPHRQAPCVLGEHTRPFKMTLLVWRAQTLLFQAHCQLLPLWPRIGMEQETCIHAEVYVTLIPVALALENKTPINIPMRSQVTLVIPETDMNLSSINNYFTKC